MVGEWEKGQARATGCDPRTSDHMQDGVRNKERRPKKMYQGTREKQEGRRKRKEDRRRRR